MRKVFVRLGTVSSCNGDNQQRGFLIPVFPLLQGDQSVTVSNKD